MPDQKFVRSAIAASLLFHGVVLAAMAIWPVTASSSRVWFAGRDQVIQLTVSTVEPQWSLEPDSFELLTSDAPVVIEPNEARIAKRRYVHIPVAELKVADFSLDLKREITSGLPERATPDNLQEPSWEKTLGHRSAQPTRRITTPDIPDLAVVELPSSSANTRDTPPDLSQNAPPTYPGLAIQRGWEGTVLLRISIDESGRVTKLEVARSSGYPILDGAAATAVRQWTASPAYRDGKPVATVEVLPVRFKL